MLGFTTKKERERIDRSIEQEVLDNWIKETLERIELLKTPLEKLLLLESNIEVIDAEIEKRNNKISKEARKKGALAYFASTVTGYAAGFLFVTSSSGLLLPTVLTLSSIIGLTYIAPKVTTSAKKQLNLKNSNFINFLNNKRKNLLKLGREIVGENVVEIANAAVNSDVFFQKGCCSMTSVFDRVTTANIKKILTNREIVIPSPSPKNTSKI